MKSKRTTVLLTVVLGLLLGRDAQAFYNPSTGHWLSRDPIGEEGGLSLYGFLGNDGVGGWDHLGLCSCCCCAENVLLVNLKKYNDGDLYGHTFKVVASLQSVEHAVSGDCKFSWKEKSNRPSPFALDHGAKPDEWYETVEMDGSASKMKWDTHATLCPGCVGVWIPDTPVASLELPKRVMYFAIRLESSAGCPCAKQSVTLCATQTLEPGPRRTIKLQDFTLTVPDDQKPPP